MVVHSSWLVQVRTKQQTKHHAQKEKAGQYINLRQNSWANLYFKVQSKYEERKQV